MARLFVQNLAIYINEYLTNVKLTRLIFANAWINAKKPKWRNLSKSCHTAMTPLNDSCNNKVCYQLLIPKIFLSIKKNCSFLEFSTNSLTTFEIAFVHLLLLLLRRSSYQPKMTNSEAKQCESREVDWTVSVTRKNCKMSKKLPKNDFTRKMKDFDTFTKIA